MSKLDQRNTLVVTTALALVAIMFIIVLAVCDVRANPHETQRNKDKIVGCESLDSSDARATCMVVLVGGGE